MDISFLTALFFLSSYSDFQAYCRLKKNKTFISKPESGCQGKGIAVFKNPKVAFIMKFLYMN